MDSQLVILALDQPAIEMVYEYSILLGFNVKRTLYDQIPFGYEIFIDDGPYMQTKNGVYCCSLDICMTSDNYYSLDRDQDNQAAFAADQLLDRQANDEWGYAPLEMLKRLKVYLRQANQQRAEDAGGNRRLTQGKLGPCSSRQHRHPQLPRHHPVRGLRRGNTMCR
jgi:hypothetical protein